MELQDKVNVFLDSVRESGAINMFGAAPYVAEAFGVSKQEARDLVKNWMQTFAERNAK
jgi:hypothetical protein